jgi:hypothetical protein
VSKKLAKSIRQIETVTTHAAQPICQHAELGEDSDDCGSCKAIEIQASQCRELRISHAMYEEIHCAGSEVKNGTKSRR